MSSTRPAVLIVDDDLGTRETVDWVLRPAGFRVDMASTGADGLRLARTDQFGLLLLDYRLPDMFGTDLIRALRDDTPPPFVLVSGFLTTDITVEAMKLGASDVIEKPITIEALRDCVHAVFDSVSGPIQPSPRSDRLEARDHLANRSASIMRPRSSAERWAFFVLRGCVSENDPTTLLIWARCACVSLSSLVESCYLLGIKPQDARDFTRVLRALVRSSRSDRDPETLLDVSDRRTLKKLLDRTGLPNGLGGISVDEFFTGQRLVARHNPGIRALQALMVRSRSTTMIES
jgi:FixJ family two-component response regulator